MKKFTLFYLVFYFNICSTRPIDYLGAFVREMKKKLFLTHRKIEKNLHLQKFYSTRLKNQKLKLEKKVKKIISRKIVPQ